MTDAILILVWTNLSCKTNSFASIHEKAALGIEKRKNRKYRKTKLILSPTHTHTHARTSNTLACVYSIAWRTK